MVDEHPRCQRVLFVKQPFGQTKPVFRIIFTKGQDKIGRIGLHFISRGIVGTASQNVRFTDRIQVTHHRHNQTIGIGFVNKSQNIFYVLVADFHQRLLRIRFRTANDGLNTYFFYIVKKRKELVIFFLGKWVVFMVVTVSTFQRNPQKCLSKQIISVRNVTDAVLFGNYAAFFRNFMISVETRCQKLLLIRRGILIGK